jgi:hypothetical protein
MTMPKLTSALLIGLSLCAVSSTAFADDDEDMPPPPPMMPAGPPPVYQAPLAQTTQGTYVPQSVALSGPEEITDNTEGRAAPAGYTAVQRSRKGLLIGGGVTLGVSYGISALTASIGEDIDSDDNEVAALWIPVAGPFIQIANTDSATAKVFLVGLGAAQVAGAVMLYYGLTTKKTVFVRNDLVGSLGVGPMVGEHNTTGMVVSGRF